VRRLELWKKSEMRYKWKRYNWWLYCVFGTIAFGLFLYYLHPSTDQDNARYILSAISQGLAAILALVFTITLVVAQMTRRYTAMDKFIFRRGTIILMIIFGIGVVAPLLVLKFGLCRLGVNLSIVVAIFCVFSLMPFLKGINWVLKYEVGVFALFKESMAAIRSENKESVALGELTEIGERAVTEAPENTVVSIIRLLSEIGERCAIENGFQEETYKVIMELSVIGLECVGRKLEEASFFAAQGLSDIGVDAAKNRFSIALLEPSELAVNELIDIGTKAAEKGLKKWDITIRAVEGVKDIFTALHMIKDNRVENEREESIAVNGVWCLGAFVMEYLPEQCDRVIQRLKEIENEIGRKLLMKYEEGCIVDHPNLKSALETFKKQYNER